MPLSRQEYLNQLATSLIQNPTVPQKYRSKLQDLLRRNKILYVSRADRQTIEGMQRVYGTASIKTGKIRITSLCWTRWEARNQPEVIPHQIQKTLLHEVKHLLLRTAGHPKGRDHFDKEFANIDWHSNKKISSQKISIQGSHLSTIHQIVRKVIADTSIDYDSRVKLAELLQKNKFLYIKQVFIRNAEGTRAAYCTVRKASQEIIITERCWTYGGKKNTAKRTATLIQKSLLHEVQYLL
jgi:hypothetical protein